MTKINSTVLAGLCIGFATSSFAQARDYLPYDAAAGGIAACVAMAKETNANVAIVIIDRADQIVAAARMDEILPAAYEGAHLKAYSALNFYQPSGDIGAIMEAIPAFKDIPGIVTIPGGHPIFSVNGTIIGAVGVAGFPDVQTDAECAQRALEQIAG
ncbi:MAG: heme-binding protein [Litoreibacter sp.]|nr:heme-binding protein [Litoreibacter sp.]